MCEETEGRQTDRDRGTEGGTVERARWMSFDIFSLDEAIKSE